MNSKIYIILFINILFQSGKLTLEEMYLELNANQETDNHHIIGETKEIISIGKNILGKEIFLSQKCAQSWLDMNAHAKKDSIILSILSGFRSYEKQYNIIQNKLMQGRSLDEILRENKLPGLSQHHSGNAIDIISNGYKLSVDFEKSPAYKWLVKNANKYGFYLQYPKNNKENIMFEPWHWLYKE